MILAILALKLLTLFYACFKVESSQAYCFLGKTMERKRNIC